MLQSQPLIGHDTDVNTTSYGTSKSSPGQGHGFIPKGPTSSQPHKANANSTRVSICIHRQAREAAFNNLRCSRSFLERKPNKKHAIESSALPHDVTEDSKEQSEGWKCNMNVIVTSTDSLNKHLLEWTSIEASEGSIAAWISNDLELHRDAIWVFPPEWRFYSEETLFNPAVHPAHQIKQIQKFLWKKNIWKFNSLLESKTKISD